MKRHLNYGVFSFLLIGILSAFLVLFSGCTMDSDPDPDPDNELPKVVSVYPLNSETSVAINVNITAAFDESMNESSFTSSSFTLSDGINSVHGAVSYGEASKTATFNPDADLQYITQYFAAVTTGAADLAGNNMEADHTWSFTTGTAPDTDPPAGCSVVINGGDTYTTSMNVTLTLSATDAESGVTHMMISNYSDFPGASWETFDTTKDWELISGSGEKTIYTKFRDGTGNESDACNDSIFLDTDAPAPPFQPNLADDDDTGTSNTDNITNKTSELTFSGGGAEADSTVTLYSDRDGTLGSTTASGTGTWIVDLVSLTENVHRITAKVRDSAGNESSASKDLQVTVDTTATHTSILTPFQGENTGKNLKPTFTWREVSDAVSYDLQVADTVDFSGLLAINEEGLTTTEYTPVSDMTVSTLQPKGTRYFIRIRTHDKAGNVSAWSSDSMLRYVNVGRFDKDFNGDGYSDLIIGAYGYDDGANSDAGKVYIFYGNGTSMSDIPDVTMTGEASGDFFGRSVASAGDVNNDGYLDIIIGAPWNDAGGNSAGRAYIYYGGDTVDNIIDVTLTGEAAGDYFGGGATAGDMNGDGYSDVLVSSNHTTPGSTYYGTAYVFYGGSSMDDIADITIAGEDGSINIYSPVSAGDVNGDGYPDILAGDGYYDVGSETDAGQAYIYFGGPSMDKIPDITMSGESRLDNFGLNLASAGDVNTDGYADVIVGAFNYGTNEKPHSGKAYIYYGGSSMNNSADVELVERHSIGLGYEVASAGDLNGDGYSDVIVGAQNGGGGSEEAYIYYGSSSMDSTDDLILTGEVMGDRFGQSLASAGDVNGNGYSDVIIGAHYYDAGSNRNAGKAYLYQGGDLMDSAADLSVTGEAENDYFGCSMD